ASINLAGLALMASVKISGLSVIIFLISSLDVHADARTTTRDRRISFNFMSFFLLFCYHCYCNINLIFSYTLLSLFLYSRSTISRYLLNDLLNGLMCLYPTK